MATYASIADMNFTDAWNLIDSTSFLDAESASSGVGISPLDSSSFTPGAIVLWGMAVKFATRTSSVATFTAVLRTGGADVSGTSVTIDTSSVPADGGWVFLNFRRP